MLGTASATPTRYRNHNGYLLRFDDQLLLFDPGEGTQRQATLADAALARLTGIAITHFHGDHCLGLPGVIQRLCGDKVRRDMPIVYAKSGQKFFHNLRNASAYDPVTPIHPIPIDTADIPASDRKYPFPVHRFGKLDMEAAPLDHRIESIGYRISEPDGRSFKPELLAERGIEGRDVGELHRRGEITIDGVTTTIDDVSEFRRGQSVAVVMDTRVCDAAVELARDVDMLIIESTFLHEDADLAHQYGHLTALQAAEIAREAGARRLVLTHFSQRYPDTRAFLAEAAPIHDDVFAARDLDVIPLPTRLTS